MSGERRTLRVKEEEVEEEEEEKRGKRIGKERKGKER